MNKEWFDERNKRTDALQGVNDGYKKIRIKVIVTSGIDLFTTQVMVTTTVNILSRWCQHIDIHFSKDTVRSVHSPDKKGRSIQDALTDILKNNTPGIHFSFNRPDCDNDLSIYIGEPDKNETSPFISIDANGWVVSCAFNHSAPCKGGLTDSLNPLGAAYAACLANAEAFRFAVGMRTDPYVKWYSILDNITSDICILNEEKFDNALSIGRVHVVGCGAIGSSFADLLSLTKWKGNILFADMNDKVELHNTSSSLLFTQKHVDEKIYKVHVCENQLKDKEMKTSVFNDEYGKYPYDHLNREKSADLILCFANDKNIWSTIQHLYPPVVFHATTSSSWGINIGRHIPFKDQCIYCTFKELMKIVYVPQCAAVIIPDDGGVNINTATAERAEPVAAILPFLSPVAAILTMTEVYKLYTRDIDRENSLEVNMSTAEGVFMQDYFKPGQCVVCSSQSIGIHNSLNAGTFFMNQ